MNRHGKVGAQREAALERTYYTGDSNFTPEHLHSMSFQILQLRSFRPRRVALLREYLSGRACATPPAG